MSETLFKCPHCSKDIFMKESGTYKSFECPHCNNTIQPLSASSVPAATNQQKPKLSCPSCNAEMQTNAVICTSCGLDLRTGQKIATSSIGLGIKKETEGMPESIFSRFGMKSNVTWQDIQRRQRSKKISITLVTIFVPVLIFAGLSYFIDFGKSESMNWKQALTALSALKTNQKNAAALQILKDNIPKLGDGLTGHIPKTGLMAIWALGQINIGNTNVGLNAYLWIERKSTNTSISKFISTANFIHSPVCQACQGSGKVTSKQLDVPRLYTPERDETERKIHRLGKVTGEVYSAEAPIVHNCGTCQGKGRLSPQITLDRLHSHNISLIKKLYAYAMVKYYFERIVDIEIFAHKFLSGNHMEPPFEVSTETFFQTSENNGVFFADKDEENAKYEKLYEKFLTQFSQPKAGELIKITPDGGKSITGILSNITESEVSITLTTGKASLTMQKAQLDQETRLRCFRNDYAAFQARKALLNKSLHKTPSILLNK